MKLRIITGRAGAGKSKLVLETIAAQRFERPQILLVPEHATHEAELDLCRALGDTASRDGEVLSFQSLATRVLSQTGGISDITLDNGGKILIMRRALQEVSSYLTVFSKPSQRPAFLRELVALADELYAYKIAPFCCNRFRTFRAPPEISCALRRCCSALMTRDSTAATLMPGQKCRNSAINCRILTIYAKKISTLMGFPISTERRRISLPPR